ncbi:MAG: NOP5/NOP56 family protein [Halodesulfurarchaeum sp.]
MTEQGWFSGLDPDDVESAAIAIREGHADEPRDWPAEAVQSDFVPDRSTYYRRLQEAAIRATSEAVRDRERADDQQLVHAVRTMDDLSDVGNELAERAAEWAGSHYGETREGLDYVEEVADRAPDGPVEERIVSLARRSLDVLEERADLRTFVTSQTPTVAPNLSMLAGPVLAARLISIAGSLESLAKKPSGTVQVLGAEDALFAHLRGHAPSPKHGIIYTHEYVRETPPDQRGSASRALAGKLSIAARIDYYSGDRRPELATELDRRIERIRGRGPEE